MPIARPFAPPSGPTTAEVQALIAAAAPYLVTRDELATRADVGATADDTLFFPAAANTSYFVQAALLTYEGGAASVANQVQIIAPDGSTGSLSFLRVHAKQVSGTGVAIVERQFGGPNEVRQNRDAVDAENGKSQPNYYIAGVVTTGSTAGNIAVGWGVNSGGASGNVYANVGSSLQVTELT